MVVHQEIAAGSIFVLADAALGNCGIAQRGKTMLYIAARLPRALRGSEARLDVRVHAFAVPIERDFQSARFEVWHAINLIVLEEPGGQRRRSKTRIARRRGEEKHFLAGGKNAWAKNFREKLSKPRTTGKDHVFSQNRFALAGFDHLQGACCAG